MLSVEDLKNRVKELEQSEKDIEFLYQDLETRFNQAQEDKTRLQ